MAAGIAITRHDRSADELRLAASRLRNGTLVRRVLALAMVLDGASRAEAAQACGMDRQTLRDWVHRYNEHGLIAAHSPGQRRLVSVQVEQPKPLKGSKMLTGDLDRHQDAAGAAPVPVRCHALAGLLAPVLELGSFTQSRCCSSSSCRIASSRSTPDFGGNTMETSLANHQLIGAGGVRQMSPLMR
jgi:transposase-like protein